MANRLSSHAADLRYAVRQFRLNPGFAVVAILSLALGIGANAAIFQLINAISMRALPVREPWRLAAVDIPPDFLAAGWMSGRTTALTFAQYRQLMERQESFEDVLAFNATRFNLARGGQARYAEGLFVSSNFFELLGVAPILGRGLAPQPDDRPCADSGAILNYAFWQSEFGGDPSAVGQTISLDGRRFRVDGVTPKDFSGLEPARRFDVALPLCADALFDEKGVGRVPNKMAWFVTLVGRLRPGWTVERASQHLHALSPAIFSATVPDGFTPDTVKKYLANRLKVVSAAAGVSDLRSQYETPLWLLLSLTGLVLLIACANLANLLLARATTREREMAVRLAIGASRGRLIRQLMVESLLLAAAGAALGASVAQSVSQALIAFLSTGNQRLLLESAFDWRVFGFVTALAVLTCVLFGITPALRATRVSPASAMRARGNSASQDKAGLRKGLVVAQIAICVVLLVGAILFGRSLQKLVSADTGIGTEGVVLATVSAGVPGMDPVRRSAAFDQLLGSASSLPGVASVSTVAVSPFSGEFWNRQVEAGEDIRKVSWFNRVGPGYFAAMRTPLLGGREFSRGDNRSAPAVAIVNEEFARVYFRGVNPVGRTFRIVGNSDTVFQIVGQVRNTKYGSLREKTRSIVYLARDQEEEAPQAMTLVVRTTGAIGTVIDGIRRYLASAHPDILVEFRILDVQVRESVQMERLMASLTGAFGILAALLSMLGLFGVMSYTVARRRSEIGIRMAVGAARQDVTGLVMRETGKLVLLGLAIGAALSLGVTRYAKSLLFELQPNDPAALAGACALLSLTATVATWIPARRAVRLDPAAVLREE